MIREKRPVLAFSGLLLWGCGHVAMAEQGPAGTASTARTAQTSFVSPYSYEWFVRAELLEARGQHAAAAEAYRMALGSADDDPYLLSRLAEALDGAGDAAGAERALQAGLDLDPYSEAVWLERGKVARRHGVIEGALAAYERAEAAAPLSIDAPLALADLLRESGHPERALAVLERFAARSEQGSLPALRARLELARARGDGAALAEAARAWLALPGGDTTLLRRTATELLAAGRPALASRVLAALPAAAENARLRLQTCLALMQLEQAFMLLATTPPDALGGPLEVAEAYLQIGKPSLALAALEEQDSADDGDPHRRALLRGLALLDTEQPAAAALLLARVGHDSAYYARASRGLREALEAGGLDALAHEVEAARRPPTAGN